MKEKTMATVTAYYNENNETLTNDIKLLNKLNSYEDEIGMIDDERLF